MIIYEITLPFAVIFFLGLSVYSAATVVVVFTTLLFCASEALLFLRAL
jgi:hypothetical protein